MMCLLRMRCRSSLQKMNFFNDICDDILIDILTRLPVRQIVRCRTVCRRWHRLILNPTFGQVHLDPSSSARLVPFFQIRGRALNKKLDRGMERLYFVDWEEYDQGDDHQSYGSNRRKKKKKKKKMIKSVTIKLNPKSIQYEMQIRLRCCCDGLLIFAEVYPPYTHFICNPITNETAVLGLGFPGFRVCGFYFHLPTNSYRLLCLERNLAQEGTRYRYYVCGLDLVELREVGESDHTVGLSVSCLTIDGFMYMEVPLESCSRFIVTYDLNTEQMTFMPHPQFAHPAEHPHQKMNLIEMESELGFCSMDMNQGIDIWVLEDRGNWVWTKKYSVGLLVIMKLRFDYPEYSLSIRNQELIVWSPFRGIFKYHLVLGIAERIAKPRHYWQTTYCPVFVTNGRTSFISPHHLISHLNK